jgi:hypothetical protein
VAWVHMWGKLGRHSNIPHVTGDHVVPTGSSGMSET